MVPERAQPQMKTGGAAEAGEGSRHLEISCRHAGRSGLDHRARGRYPHRLPGAGSDWDALEYAGDR